MESVANKRVEHSRAAVLKASIELLNERGYEGFSVVQLVARTGIARTTIYRHWATRADLLSEVIQLIARRGDVPDTGSLRGDLQAFFAVQAVKRHKQSPTAFETLPTVVDAARRDPSVAGVVAEIAVSVLGQLRVILGHAVDRGEVREDCDLDAIANILLGAVHVQRNFLNQGPSANYVNTVLDVMLNGVIPQLDTTPKRPAASPA